MRRFRQNPFLCEASVKKTAVADFKTFKPYVVSIDLQSAIITQKMIDKRLTSEKNISDYFCSGNIVTYRHHLYSDKLGINDG